jgi:hypothetical protein
MKKYLLGIAAVVASAALITTHVAAATTVVVTPSNTQGFSTADTRPGGAVAFVSDPTSPLPTGALQLTTDATNEAKAQYLHATNTPLSQITELAYQTKQVGGPAVADPSYQLAVDLNGATTGGFTTLVYEPYWNGTVTPSVWQAWDVDAGQFWSSSSFTEATCTVTSGAGGPPFYTLAGLQAACPNAVVLGFGVNIGTYNPSYTVEADALNFNTTVYDFELDPVVTPTPSASPTLAPTATPTSTPTIAPSATPSLTPTPSPAVLGSKDECKNNGWKNFTNPTFKNQGQCVSYFNHQ